MIKRFFQKLAFQALLFIPVKIYAQDTAQSVSLQHLPVQWTLVDCIDFAKRIISR